MVGVTFSDADIDVTTSHDGGRVICRKNKDGEDNTHKNVLDDSIISPIRMRSNSVCIYCTGQHVDKVF